MIVTITGLPGNGKTLYALNWVKAKAEKEGRPVYYSGIKDLALPWTEVDPEKWFELPPNSIVVIDECQRVFRPRMHGSKVPEYVERLETHRHQGIDLVLITQHPMLIDSNVRRLCGLHFHVVRKFGMAAATVHEWGSIKENCDKVRSDSVRHEFKYPKASYKWYKSAEVHTHKARIPMRVWVALTLPLIFGALVWFVWAKWQARIQGEGEPPPVGVSDKPAAVARGPAGPDGRQADALTPAQFVQHHQPRVPGLAFTAPVYDEVTKPVEAPYPAACVQTRTRCQCYTQQATRLNMPDDMCRQIAEGGFFLAWQRPQQPPQQGQYELPAVVQAVPASFGINGARPPLRQEQADPAAPIEQDPARPRVRR